MTTMRRLAATSLIALLAAASFCAAQEQPQQDLQAVEQDITLSKERQQQLAAEAKSAVDAQEELSKQLVTLAETAAEQEKKLALAEKRQTKLKNKVAAINLDLAAKQDQVALVLAGLQRLEQNPAPALVVSPDDVLDALRGAMVFGTIVPELRKSAQELHDKLAELKSLREQLEQQALEHQEALNAVATSRTEIDKLIEEKKALASASREQLAAEKQRAEELAAKATNLKDLIAKLEQEKAAAEAKRTAEEKARLEAEQKRLAELNKPTIMADAKGQLNFPAQGQILKGFGAQTGLGGKLDGIVITTLASAQVTSPIAGKIEFAGKFRSYGEMVIINPGQGYLVLLAGLHQIQTAQGQFIKPGEPIGVMGEKPGKLAVSNGFTNLTTPVLYVEFRKNGNPIDPTPWWIGKRQEAMR
jgi:murein hydrolase activator